MRIQALSLVAAFVMLASLTARASCYNFSVRITDPPNHPSILLEAEPPRVSTKSGKLKDVPVWAAARGNIARPIRDLIRDLARHESMKSGKISEMKVDSLKQPEFFLRQKVHYTVKPFLFMTVAWTEDWAFSLIRGSALDPRQVNAFYEKTDGTSHIRHLCGSIVLEKKGPSNTDVFIYEEAQATGRSEEDTLKGLIGTIQTLRSGRRVE